MPTNHCVFHKFGELLYQINDFLTSLDMPFISSFPLRYSVCALLTLGNIIKCATRSKLFFFRYVSRVTTRFFLVLFNTSFIGIASTA